MKNFDLPEKVHDAKFEAAVDAINLLAYDKSLWTQRPCTK